MSVKNFWCNRKMHLLGTLYYIKNMYVNYITIYSQISVCMYVAIKKMGRKGREYKLWCDVIKLWWILFSSLHFSLLAYFTGDLPIYSHTHTHTHTYSFYTHIQRRGLRLTCTFSHLATGKWGLDWRFAFEISH